MFRILIFAFCCCVTLPLAARAVEKKPLKKLLFVTHSGGFIHDSVGVAEDVVTKVGPQFGYEVTCFRFTGKSENTQELEAYSAKFRARTSKPVSKENCGRINAETLKKFDAVLFFTTGNPMTAAELKDLMAWVKAGGAFTGTHCATDTMYKDAAYGDLIGAYFRGHPPGVRKVKLNVEDPKHPAATFAPGTLYEDEIYVFRDQPYDRAKLHIILSTAQGSFDPGQKLKRQDNDYAISWCKEYGKGKVFYTSLGHKKQVWQDETFQKHLFGGIDWACGKVHGDASPSKK